MKITATDTLHCFKASILASQYGIDINDAKALKGGIEIIVSDETAEKMSALGLVKTMKASAPIAPSKLKKDTDKGGKE